MRICIIGTGAVGGFLAVKFALAGEDVTAVDRGTQLAAIRDRGLRLISEDGSIDRVEPSVATDDPTRTGPYDLMILAVKAYDVPSVARWIPSVVGPETMVLTVQNGIPWWYFQRYGGSYEGYRLATLDPKGEIERSIPAARLLGCVAYPALSLEAPGVIRQIQGDRFPVGELDGSDSARVHSVSDLFRRAGLRSKVLTDIRSEIWLKAWGNLSFNPISALTGATLREICRFPSTRALAAGMMGEAKQVAEKLGIRFRHTIDERIAGAERVGMHRTSMLQDLETGNPIELDALVGSVLELARLTDTSTPMIEAVYACTALLAGPVPAG